MHHASLFDLQKKSNDNNLVVNKYSLLVGQIHTDNKKQNKTLKLKRDSQKQMQRNNIQMYEILNGFSSDTILPLLKQKTLGKKWCFFP